MPTAEEKKKKKHVLIMDDSLNLFAQAQGVQLENMFEGSGQDFEVVVATTPEYAKMVLHMWADTGIKPDIVSIDFLYGRSEGPREYEYIAEKIYNGREALKPEKLFVHSKSGLYEYEGSEYNSALAAMKRIGAEYCHTFELLKVAEKFGSDRDRGDDFMAPSTKVFRNYLKTQFGLDVSSITREDVEKEKEKARLDKLGDKMSIYDAQHAVLGNNILKPFQALRRIDPDELANTLSPTLELYDGEGKCSDYHPIAFKKGTGGAACGVAAFSKEEVLKYKAQGKKVILILENFTPGDAGLLTQVDGVVLLGRGSSHLPILCDNFGIPGIFKQYKTRWTGDKDPLSIQKDGNSYMLVSKGPPGRDDGPPLYDFTIKSGQEFSIKEYNFSTGDGIEHREGELYRGPHPVKAQDVEDNWALPDVLRWADDARRTEWHRRDNPLCHGLMVKINIDGVEQAQKGFKNGADGVGLLRTEHMFMTGNRLNTLQLAMLADDPEVKRAAIKALKHEQKADFKEIFKAAAAAERKNWSDETYLLPLPVTMRLLDSKPDELLPQLSDNEAIARLAHEAKLDEATVRQKIKALTARNVRGAQFATNGHMDIYAMQAEAFFEAAREAGIKSVPEIMVPMVKDAAELAEIKKTVDQAARERGYINPRDERLYRFGAMIETKDAVANAETIAKISDFLSFGTNDLTQELTGLPRDDVEAVDKWMNANGQKNPYRILSNEVKAAMKQTALEARKANDQIIINACGGQVAGEKDSIAFCQSIDLNAISVPPTLASLAASRIIAGQEAMAAYEKVRAENKKYHEKINRVGKIKPRSERGEEQTTRSR